MAIKSYPYTSVNGDRKITASSEAERLDQIVGSGIIFDVPTSFECSKVDGSMNISIASGSAIVAGHTIISDAAETVPISASDSANPRIDIIALESNINTDVRTGRIAVIKGTAAATPIEPALSTNIGVLQIKLAKVLVPPSVASLSTATLTDLRTKCVGKHEHLKAQIKDIATWLSFVGEIKIYGGSIAPTGTLLCDGTAVSRTVYADLFNVIGTTYGMGDGSTTFNLPNMCGKAPVGLNNFETEFNALGKIGGEKTHLLTIAEMPSHSHQEMSNINYADRAAVTGTDWTISPVQRTGYAAGSATQSTGGGESHNNLQPYITVNYIIKY